MLQEFLIPALLFLPFIQLMVSIARYIIGLNFSSQNIIIFLSYIFIFSSYQGGEQNFIKGIVFVALPVTVMMLGYVLLYKMISKLYMHYFAKQTIIVSIALAAVMLSINLVEINIENWVFQVIAFVLTAIVSLEVMSLYVRIGKKKIKLNILNSFIIAFVSYCLFSTVPFRTLLVENQYLVLLPAVVSIFIGRYTGLRISE
jgi:hypothetical protein